jgi:hypothetical protein
MEEEQDTQMKHQHHTETMNLAGAIVISAPIWGTVISTAIKAAAAKRKKRRAK